MRTRNILRKFTRADGIFLACLLATLGGILLYNANKQADGFITVAHDDPERFVNGENILIKRVHEDHWNIFYGFDEDCPDSRKTEENYRLLRESLERGIRIWLAPLREITDRPIVDKFVFFKTGTEKAKDLKDTRSDISAVFACVKGRSVASREGVSIYMRETHLPMSLSSAWIAPTLPYYIGSFLHELGHAFDLADTYVGNPSFSPASTGDSIETIGRQPQSIMSIGVGCGGWGLCLDDKRAIQWLYRYHWEGLDPTNCPPEFEYEALTHEGRTVGGCVLKHPLIVELRQKHLSKARQILGSDKNLKINDKDKHGNTALHYLAPLHLDFDKGDFRLFLKRVLEYPGIDVTVTDNYGNTPLHWAAWFGNPDMVGTILFTVKDGLVHNKNIKLNAQNKYGETALHHATKTGREMWCVDHLLFHQDINPNIKESRFGNTPLHEAAKNGHTEVVTMLLAHEDINPNLRNDAGFTPLQLAMQGGAVAAADSDTSFQAQHPELWVSLSEENRQQLLERSRLSPAELQRARAEITALLRAHPGIILPEASDVNGDGVVNILDLVKVSNAFGQRGPVPEDVNGDGIVNIQDLVYPARLGRNSPNRRARACPSPGHDRGGQAPALRKKTPPFTVGRGPVPRQATIAGDRPPRYIPL